MAEIEITVPEIGESITEVTIAQWLKKDGDYVALDEEIAEFDSDKATLEFPAPHAGKLTILVEEGNDVEIGSVICKIDTSATAPELTVVKEAATSKKEPAVSIVEEPAAEVIQAPVVAQGEGEKIEVTVPEIGESINEVTLVAWLKEDGEIVQLDEEIAEFDSDKATLEFPSPAAGKLIHVAKLDADLKVGDVIGIIDTSFSIESAAPAKVQTTQVATKSAEATSVIAPTAAVDATPVAANIIANENINAASIKGSGADGKIRKQDVVAFLKNGGKASTPSVIGALENLTPSREQRTEKMSRLRKTISKRLVAVKNETAMLTTFNDVDMSAVMALRTKYKAKFEEKHGIRLGFMSFFMKACTIALEKWPAVNAYLDEGKIVFNEYVDISIAVSTPKGLLVPVVRNCETLSMAGMEAQVRALAKKGRDGSISMEEMTGGTFTITNGGVFGSLMSTPIINAPQSAILGMHRIEERPVVVDGEMVVKPMMYLALSYDHRIIDGRESVGFLVEVKEQLQNPERMLLGEDPVELLLGL